MDLETKCYEIGSREILTAKRKDPEACQPAGGGCGVKVLGS